MADGMKKGVIKKCLLDGAGKVQGDCSDKQVIQDDLYTIFESDIFQTDQTILIEASP